MTDIEKNSAILDNSRSKNFS